MDPSSSFNYAIPIKKNVLSYLYLHGKSRRCKRKAWGTKLFGSVGTFCMFMLYRTSSVFCEHCSTKVDKLYLLVYEQNTLCTISVE